MEAQLNSIISATSLTSLRTRLLKINFCKYNICSAYIVVSLSFFRCEAAIFIIFPRKLIATSLLPTPLLFIGLLPRTGFIDLVLTSLHFIDSRRCILIPGWLPTKRCDASNFKKSVASQLAKRLIFVILRINDFLTTLKDVPQNEKLTAPYTFN